MIKTMIKLKFVKNNYFSLEIYLALLAIVVLEGVNPVVEALPTSFKFASISLKKLSLW